MSSSGSSCGTSQLLIRGCVLTSHVHSPASARVYSSALLCGTRRHLLQFSHCTHASLSLRFDRPPPPGDRPSPIPCFNARRVEGLSAATMTSSPASVRGWPCGAYTRHRAAPNASSGSSSASSAANFLASASNASFRAFSSILRFTPFSFLAAVQRRALGVHEAVPVTVGHHHQRRVLVLAVVLAEARFHEQTGRARAQRVVREVTPRVIALDLRAVSLFAHRAQELPAFALNRVDLIDRLHRVHVQHGRLRDPLAARGVAPPPRLRRRLQRAALHGAQAAQRRLGHDAAGVFARGAEPPHGVVRNLRDAVTRLMDGYRAALARHELVEVKVAVVVAHRTSIDGPLHADDLVPEPFSVLGDVALRARAAAASSGSASSSASAAAAVFVATRGRARSPHAAVEPSPDGHANGFDHANRRLPLLRLAHPGVFLKLRRAHRRRRALARAAVAPHPELSHQEVRLDAVADHRGDVRPIRDVFRVEVLAPVARPAIDSRFPPFLRGGDLLLRQGQPVRAVQLALRVLGDPPAHVLPAVLVEHDRSVAVVVPSAAGLVVLSIDLLDVLSRPLPWTDHRRALPGRRHGRDHLPELVRLFFREVLVLLALRLRQVPPRLTLDLVQLREVRLLPRRRRVPLSELLEKVRPEQLPRGLRPARDPARGFLVLDQRHRVREVDPFDVRQTRPPATATAAVQRRPPAPALDHAPGLIVVRDRPRRRRGRGRGRVVVVAVGDRVELRLGLDHRRRAAAAGGGLRLLRGSSGRLLRGLFLLGELQRLLPRLFLRRDDGFYDCDLLGALRLVHAPRAVVLDIFVLRRVHDLFRARVARRVDPKLAPGGVAPDHRRAVGPLPHLVARGTELPLLVQLRAQRAPPRALHAALLI
eukprot:30986-Pelagococcus_subviridis.AAC.12